MTKKFIYFCGFLLFLMFLPSFSSNASASEPKKFILLGDSYSDHYTPAPYNTSWMGGLMRYYGQENVYALGEGGVGFVGYNSRGLTFEVLARSLAARIPDKNAITHIVVCGGHTDMKISPAALFPAMQSFSDFCHRTFPNAQIYYGMIGWGPGAWMASMVTNAYENAMKYVTNYGIYNIVEAHYALHGHEDLFPDGTHCNAEGSQIVANVLYNYFETHKMLGGPQYNGLIQSGIDHCWYYVRNGEVDFGFSGLVRSPADNRLFYVQNGMADSAYTGLVQSNDDGQWYYLRNGAVDYDYTGLAYVPSKDVWYYVRGGSIDGNYTGLVYRPENDTWYYVDKGVLNWGAEGFVEYNGSIYYVCNSTLEWGKSGLYQVNGTWYYLENSVFQGDYTGLVYRPENDTWFYVQKGVLNWGIDGFAEYNGQKFCVTNSTLVWGKHGLHLVNGTWYCLLNSVLQEAYTGLVYRPENDTWYYVQNGVLNWGETAVVPYNGRKYFVENSTLTWGISRSVNINGTAYNVVNSTVVE